MRILPNFPVLSKLSQILEKYVNTVITQEKNQRQDLFVLATSYIGQLKSKSNEMIKESDFHLIGDKPAKNSQETKIVNGNSNNSSTNNHGMNENNILRKYYYFLSMINYSLKLKLFFSRNKRND